MIEELSYQSLAILAAAGVLATVVNVMAGGGGMIVLPALMALGYRPTSQTARTGSASSRKASRARLRCSARGSSTPESIVPILIPTVLGAAVGALLATWVPREVLKPIMLGDHDPHGRR